MPDVYFLNDQAGVFCEGFRLLALLADFRVNTAIKAFYLVWGVLGYFVRKLLEVRPYLSI